MSDQQDFNVKITVDGQSANAQVGKFDRRLKDAERQGKKTGDVVVGSFSRMAKAAIAATAAFLTFGAAFKGLQSTIRVAAKFETGLVGVAKTTGLAGQELRSLSADIDALSRKIPVGTDELLELGQSAGQLGVKGSADILAFTETIAKLGRASDLQGEFAAKTLARILNITGEAAGSVGTLASVFVSLGNNVAATEREIARITNEVARSTSAFGLNFGEVSAVGAAFAALGVRAESGGSAVGRAFQAINLAVNEGGKELRTFSQSLGVNADVLSEAFKRDRIEGFMMFLESVNSLGDSAGAALKSIGLGGEEINKTIVPLAKNLDLYRKTQKLAATEMQNAQALNIEFAASMKTLESAGSRWLNNMKSIMKGFGDQFLDPFTEGLNEMSNNVDAFISDGGNLEATITNVTNAFVRLAKIVAVGGGLWAGFTFGIPLIIGTWVALNTLAISATSAWVSVAAGASPLSLLAIRIGGVSVVTQVLSGQLSALAVAAGVVFAAFAGWQIGSIIFENFELARKVSLAFVAATLKGINILKTAWAKFVLFFTFKFTSGIAKIKGLFGGFLLDIAMLLDSAGFSTLSNQLNSFASSFDLGISVVEFTAIMESLDAQLKKDNATIEETIGLMSQLKKYGGEKKDFSSLFPTTPEPTPNIEAGAFWYGRDLQESWGGGRVDTTKKITEQQQTLLDTIFPLRKAQQDFNDQLLILKSLYPNEESKEFNQGLIALRLQYGELFPVMETMKGAFDSTGQIIGDAFGNAFRATENRFESFSDTLKEGFRDLIADIISQIVRAGIARMFGSIIGGAFGGPAGATAGAAIGSSAVKAAHGVNFTVPGAGPPDSKFVGMNVSPGENVTVTPAHRSDQQAQVINQFHIDARGADDAVVERIKTVVRTEMIPQAIKVARITTIQTLQRPKHA